jgi:geranylgeranyl reductase
MEEHEVAIVGAGPAGSVCAKELAKAGVDVALFDHSHPREKPCGGAISGRIFDDFKIPRKAYETKVDWLILENQKRDRVEIHKKNMAVLVMRQKFDHYLLKEALKEEPIFYEEKVTKISKKTDKWLLETDKNKIMAKTLIGADGCPSLVRKTVLEPIPNKYLGHCAGYHIPHERDHISKKFLKALELYFLGPPYVNIGYIWIFPKFEDITIGIGARIGTPNLTQSLNKFIKIHPAAKRLNIPQKMKLHSHLIPAVSNPSFYNLPTTGKNWILTGDAAGHVNPINAEGIYYAMVGGKLAAEAYITGEINNYEKMWREKFGSDLYSGARLQKWFYTPLLINKVLTLAKRNRALQNILCNLIVPQKQFKEYFPLRFLLK